MPLDPSIILGAKPVQIDMAQFSPMNALSNVMKFKQADQESQLNALKMQEYERARREEEGLREYVGGSKGVPGADLSLPDTRRNLLRYGKTGAEYAKALNEAEEAGLRQKKIKFEIQETRGKFVAQAKRDISQNPSDANITAYKEDLLANDLFTADEKKQMAAAADKILALPVNERTPFLASQGAPASAIDLKPTVVGSSSSVYDPTTKTFIQAPAAASAPPSMVAEYTFAKTPDGGNFRGSFQDFVTARAVAGRAPPQPRAEQPPVAVVGPDNKPIYVSREEALRNKMTPASAMEGLPPKEIQTREAKFPAATSAVKTFESSAEKLAVDLERLATHPGLSGISGLVYGRTPAITKEARAAQALYDSIVARGGFQELQNMRASSPTGGALGNVSNQEGQYLRDAFAPINRTQDTADLSRSLREAAGATRSSKQRVREAYDMTYDYKTQGGGAKPAAGSQVVDFGSLK
jgi:hypothetical protein